MRGDTANTHPHSKLTFLFLIYYYLLLISKATLLLFILYYLFVFFNSYAVSRMHVATANTHHHSKPTFLFLIIYSLFSMQHILIAGGAGFVGSHLALWFKEKYPESRITAIDNLSRNGSALNVPRLQKAGVHFIQADTRFPEQLVTEYPVSLVIDAAAEPSVLAGISGGLDYLIHTNFNGTIHLLDLAKAHGAGFIFLSTSRVYPYTSLQQLVVVPENNRFVLGTASYPQGISHHGISEDFSLNGPRSLYGATKLASELMVQEYAATFGVKAVINRCGVIAGPWQMGKVDQGVTILWLAKHFWKQPLQYIGFGGNGLQVRDLLHVQDLCRLIDFEAHHLSLLNGQTLNAGGGAGNTVSLAELTYLCSELTGHEVPVTAVDENRPGDIPWYVTDNTRITAATGWRPEKTVKDILLDSYQWLQENEGLLRPVLG
jgi:CDP-paratose 2-epimerase